MDCRASRAANVELDRSRSASGLELRAFARIRSNKILPNSCVSVDETRLLRIFHKRLSLKKVPDPRYYFPRRALRSALDPPDKVFPSGNSSREEFVRGRDGSAPVFGARTRTVRNTERLETNPKPAEGIAMAHPRQMLSRGDTVVRRSQG
jgi:hypothetical protein